MSDKRKCRVCNCTQDRACITLSGPCSWVAPDLCSACAERILKSRPGEIIPEDLLYLYNPSKYDELCTIAREMSHADGAILIIINGTRGSGFAVQAPIELVLKIPALLRETADNIEAEQKKGK